MDASITAAELRQSLRSSTPPLVIDVRKPERFLESTDPLRGALRRDPAHVDAWSGTCARRSISARRLGSLARGRRRARRQAARRRDALGDARPKIDRIACPWLVKRFVDPDAEFLYVPTPEVKRVAQEREAVPYDIPDVEFSHDGELCSFDAFLKYFRLQDPALARHAVIVRGADTNRLDLAPQCAGLLAVSQGLSRNYPNDHEMLEHGMVVYDALYAWCRQ
jgi:hypothetical protein